VDSDHANLIYRCDANGVTVVDKDAGSYGVITPDVQRALAEKKRAGGESDEGEGALSFLKRVNRAFRNA
jgi:hypothetical protein